MSVPVKNKRKAILLLNVGTPDSPGISNVRKFLSEFLNDPFVIDLPWLLRKILVNLIIIPFRASKSTKLYEQLWEKDGSPLLTNALKLKEKLNARMSDEYSVFVAMRYGNPSIKSVLKEILDGDFQEVIVCPLFPQYASSTTETAIQAVKNEAKSLSGFPQIEVIKQFYDHPEFLNAWASRVREYDLQKYDHIVFSFHGLPLTHVAKIHPKKRIKDCTCEIKMPEHGGFCYKATVYATARKIAEQLKLTQEQYSVGFQSRLSRHWLSPFTDEMIMDLAEKGHKKVLILSPSFVADCLETKVELGIEYAEMFKKAGGEKLQLVKSLNDSDAWVNALDSILRIRN